MTERRRPPLTEQEIEELKKRDPGIKEFGEAAQPVSEEDRYPYDYTNPSFRQEKVEEARSRQRDAANLLNDSKEWQRFRLDVSDQAVQQIRKYGQLNEFDIEVDGQIKHYTRGKIKAKEYKELERIRAQFARETDELKRSELQMDIYEKCALYYLGMSEDDFDNSDFETLKRIIDSCNVRTIHGIVRDSPNLRSSSG